VRRMFRCLALSAALMASLAHRANSQTPEAPRRFLIPDTLIGECSEKLAKERPQIKLVGKFRYATRRANIALRLLDPGPVFAVIAPSTNLTIFGTIHRGYAGCVYEFKGGKFVFRKFPRVDELPRRDNLETGES
jgi:hypothetical protein